MRDWFLKQLGFSDEFIRHLGEVSLDVQNPRALWIGLALLVPVAAFVWLRQKRNLPTVPAGLRFTLTATRVLILALLVLVLASPIARLTHKAENKPVVGVLLDWSQSMGLPAGPFDDEAELARIALAAGYKSQGGPGPEAKRGLRRMSRAKLANAVLESSARPFLEKLADKFDVRYYSFSATASRLGVDPRSVKLPEPPPQGGGSTRIGDAIAAVQDDTAGSQLAGIILLSDGQHNAGRGPAEAARSAGAPLFAVPVGSKGRLKDVAIVDVFATSQVTVQDTALVAVSVESHGFDGRTVKVELKDGPDLLDSKEIVLRDAEQQQVELSFKAMKPGLRNLTVSVPVEKEEPDYLKANNSDSLFIRVSEERLKVLHLDGRPHWDFRFLKNNLRRDHGIGGRKGTGPDIVLETEWRRGTEKARKEALALTLDQLAEYHTVIIGDVSSDLLTPDFVKLLAQAVREKGVGLIVQAGTSHMPHRHGDLLHELLPVRLKRGKAGQQPTGKPHYRMELAPEGMFNEATRFYDEPGRNATAWSNLPPYYWCAAVERPAPGATVLVHNPIPTAFGKMPLIAHHHAGQGRVMFVGTDETFRWRQNVGERFFGRFWGQAIRFVARRDDAGGKKSRLEMRPARTTPGEPVEVELMTFTPAGAPIDLPSIRVPVMGGGKSEPLDLKPDTLVKGRYTARFSPTAQGEYVARYTPDGSPSPLEARTRVTGAAEEMRQPNVDRLGLGQLAASTKGGRLVELPDLESIADGLSGESRYTERNPEITVWDNWIVVALLVLLYTLDVGLRRLMGLS
ncbi:MAG: hypothetical protein K2W96_20765 [Gemmataceae bacterium]|nr:hypothetical protein [Gemmataceae bacterium]